MPIVVERKRADDLASSMVDGRQRTQGRQMLFSKQKCYIKELVYIVEGGWCTPAHAHMHAIARGRSLTAPYVC